MQKLKIIKQIGSKSYISMFLQFNLRIQSFKNIYE